MAALVLRLPRAIRPTACALCIASTATPFATKLPLTAPRPTFVPFLQTRPYHASPPTHFFGFFNKPKTPEELNRAPVMQSLQEVSNMIGTHQQLQQRLLETLVSTSVHNYAQALRNTSFDFRDVKAFQDHFEDIKPPILKILRIHMLLDLIPVKNIQPPFELVGLEPLAVYFGQYLAAFVLANKDRLNETTAKELAAKLEFIHGQLKWIYETDMSLIEEFESESKKLMAQLEEQGRMNIEVVKKEWEVLLKEFEDQCTDVFLDEDVLDQPLQDLTLYLVMAFPEYFRNKRLLVEKGYEGMPTRKENVLYAEGSESVSAARRKHLDAVFENQIMVVKKLYEQNLAEKGGKW